MATYTRRVQLTGGSTFIISLPSKWVKEARISKGSEVIIDDSQGVLTVTHSQARPKENARILTVTGKPNPEYFQRVLTSLYIAGFDTLTIKKPEIHGRRDGGCNIPVLPAGDGCGDIRRVLKVCGAPECA
ncbi:MAG: phosphate uptake regulator [Thermoplasmatales archaeon Gpl]|nr:MAG: phosphate uptake regulator [Thermoplasmatales archaeon Gpl]